jgi:hypothetical protein
VFRRDRAPRPIAPHPTPRGTIVVVFARVRARVADAIAVDRFDDFHRIDRDARKRRARNVDAREPSITARSRGDRISAKTQTRKPKREPEREFSGVCVERRGVRRFSVRDDLCIVESGVETSRRRRRARGGVGRRADHP